MTRPAFCFCLCPDSALLLQHVGGLVGDMERHVFWGDEELSRQFWDRLTLQGLFARERAILLRHAENLPAETWKRLSSALARPNDQVWPLICLEVPWEKGAPKIPAHIARQPCLTFAEKQKWIWKSPGLNTRSALRSHIQAQARALSLSLPPEGAERLSQTLPLEAAAVDSELQRLALLASARGGLRLEDLQQTGEGGSLDIFTLLRELENGQSGQVWRRLLEEQARGEEPLFYLLAMLQRETRLLWQVLHGEQVYVRPADLPAKKTVASRLGAAGLAQIWAAMFEADHRVKSGRANPGQALDKLLGDITPLFRAVS